MACRRAAFLPQSWHAFGDIRITSLKGLTSKLISTTEASRISGLTHSFICRLLRQGEIEGVKIGRNWLTTEEAIRKYLKQERRPGPKPSKKVK